MPKGIPKFDAFSVAAKEEVINDIAKHWPKMNAVPTDEKWALAMFILGAPHEQIAADTGKGLRTITTIANRYKDILVEIPPNVRARLDALMMWKSVGRLVARATDEAAINELSPIEATDLLKKQLPIVGQFLQVAEKLEQKAEQETDLDFDKLAGTLGQGDMDGNK